MIFIDLINNLALLVALSVLSGFVGQRWKDRRVGALLQGVIFGGVAVIGMLRPFKLAAGMIFDGRSVVISLGGLFFGPISAGVAWVMTTVCRVWQGGVGAPMGVGVITSSALLGYAFHVWRKRRKAEFNSWQLWGFGLLVHLAMLLMTLLLPSDRILGTLKIISAPVLLIYPVATVLIGKILSDHEARYAYVASLRESEERFTRAMEASRDGLWDWNVETGEVYYSPGYQTMLGYSPGELPGRLETWRDLLHPEDLPDASRTIRECLDTPKDDYEFEFRMLTRDRQWRWILARGKVIARDAQGRARRMVGTHTDLTKAKETEQTLRESEERYRTLFNDIQDGVYRSTHAGHFIEVNPAMIRILGYKTREEVMAIDIRKELYFEPEERESLFLDTGQQKVEVFRLRRRDGSEIWVEDHGRYVHDEQGNVIFHEGILRDISERKLAEQEREKLHAQLLQAHKMESVGRLAGGVAHDFNNMLGAILGYTELALEQVDATHPAQASLVEIQKAAQRSADLTRQLLAFARKQTVAPRVLDLNETVAGMLQMLRRLIGENIELTWLPGQGVWPVRMDPSQVDQILANLCVNARDAIGGVGEVIIETKNASFDESYCLGHEGAMRGDYVQISICDNGCGMDKEAQEHLFEPFYTTKSVGQGTGLGLATVYGAVKQNEGYINVYSELGKGTIFKIYLPRHAGGGEEPFPAASSAEPQQTAQGTILLVEDEPAILRMTQIMLEKMGYRVLAVGNPVAAIELAGQYAAEIRLLITDVVMPEMNGRDLAAHLLTFFPNLKRLFMSGYTADVIAHHGVLEDGVHFIQKPFSRNELAARIRETLDGE
ncbi:MAG TPA: PAS domain S-box protein [Candidatus Sumerlaeota bacterium]|nr:PAS domain S-box protein [Candidatus Sumerlaeota bacterium]